MRNEYDDEHFFNEYAQMTRSRDGLAGAGEWHQFREMLPPLDGSSVLDLGCGYGWHCKYAVEQGARKVLGIDLSERMIAAARQKNGNARITYQVLSLEDYEYPEAYWDCAVSNLVLHYIEDLASVFRSVYRTLKKGGIFLFNIEHPVFTAGVGQDWICDNSGEPLYWPVDDYFYPGERKTHFLGCDVMKYHHTLTQIINGLLECGFVIDMLEEAHPSQEMMDMPGMKDEMRRPMMLMIRAKKQ